MTAPTKGGALMKPADVYGVINDKRVTDEEWNRVTVEHLELVTARAERVEGLEAANERLRAALLARCPRHCNADHESGTCELTRREVAALNARLAPPHDTATRTPEQSPNPVGASAQSDEYRAGNTLSVTLVDLGFVFALGVAACLAVALAAFVAGVFS